MRTLSYYVDSRSFYDGNGKEIKRQTDTFDDVSWEAQPTKYYIRSSVLKRRVISEVWANGKKHHSYVKGIGNQTAVQSAYASETAQLNELVLFEFSDSSGMSYRTTNKLGAAAATGDGGEGSPIETDPLGGNVGTFTPFITLSGGEYDPTYPDDLQPFNTSHDILAPDFSSLYATFGSRVADLPGFGTNWGSFADLGMVQYEERLENSRAGRGFVTNEEFEARRRAEPPRFTEPASPEERARLQALADTGVFDNEGNADDIFSYVQGTDCRQGAMDVVTAMFTSLWSGKTDLLKERVGNLLNAAQWAGFTIAETASYLATAEQETTAFSTMYETNWSKTGEDNYTYFERVYGNRPDLGNVSPGDGWQYRGRGYVNVTGTDRYDQANNWIKAGLAGISFQQEYSVANDNINMLAEDLVLAARIGALYLQDRKFGQYLTGKNPNFYKAREVVNPNETSGTIKGVETRAKAFWAALSNCH